MKRGPAQSEVHGNVGERAIIKVFNFPGYPMSILIELTSRQVAEIRADLDMIQPFERLRRESDPEPVQADVLDGRGRDGRSVRLDDRDVTGCEGRCVDGLAEPDVDVVDRAGDVPRPILVRDPGRNGI